LDFGQNLLTLLLPSTPLAFSAKPSQAKPSPFKNLPQLQLSSESDEVLEISDFNLLISVFIKSVNAMMVQIAILADPQ
jgi:hypothetical protein